MTEFAVIINSCDSNHLSFRLEIRPTKSTTENEMTGAKTISDEVNKLLTNAKRRSRLDADWKQQYELNGIEVSEGVEPEQMELF